MYSIDPKTGKRLYTLKKVAPDGKASTSAHPGKSKHSATTNFFPTLCSLINLYICYFSYYPKPTARFSPDDKFSSQRVACKKRFGLHMCQQPRAEM